MKDKSNHVPCGVQSCIFKADGVDKRESANHGSDEQCINCVLDELLYIEDSKQRNSWINLLKNGYLEINCRRKRLNYRLLPEFFYDNMVKSSNI